MTPSRRWVRWYHGSSNRILDSLIVTLLGGMVLLAAAQILMRNLFSYSLFWGDDLLQLALLWLVMAGGVVAARTGEHIRINVLVRFVPRAARPWLYAVLHAFTGAVCGVLTWQSVRLVLESIKYGDTLFGDLPAWAAQSVMPIGFGYLAFHYVLRCLFEVFHGLNRHPTRESLT